MRTLSVAVFLWTVCCWLGPRPAHAQDEDLDRCEDPLWAASPECAAPDMIVVPPPQPQQVIIVHQVQAPQPAPKPAMGMAPSLFLGGSMNMRTDEETFFMWLGMRLYPRPAQVSALVELGMEANFADQLQLIPTLRFGVALLPDEPESFWMQLFPALQIYGILGAHVPTSSSPQTLRTGIGLSSPLGLIVTLLALGEGVVIPNALELVVDHDVVYGERSFILKYGFGF